MGEIVKALSRKPETKSQNPVSQIRRNDYSKNMKSSFENILFLQRNIGNHGVLSLMRSGVLHLKSGIDQPEDINKVKKGGNSLPESVRESYESRFGQDFKNVKIHTDAQASKSAHDLNARAYTMGQDIVFGAGQYSPMTSVGSRLLAHELAHVVQQRNSFALTQGKMEISNPSDKAEKEADTIANTFMEPESISSLSVALQMRQKLRNSQLEKPTIQREVTTWGGKWDTDKYNTIKTGAQEDGVDIELRFKPGDPVDATMIGMTQMVTSRDKGAVVAVSPTVASRSLPAGKGGEGAHIDQLSSGRNPLYATLVPGGAKDKLWDTPTKAIWGQHGFHHVDKSGVVHKKDALLKDSPQLPGRGVNASQLFETTALAVTGVQTGAYYGSVRWGWRTDAAGKFSKIPLSKVSDDVPSGTFARAQGLWNKSKDVAGRDLIKFYTASARYINAPDTPIVQDPDNPGGTQIDKLPTNVRVEVLDKGLYRTFNKVDPNVKWWKVTPVEGKAIGKVGWVMSNMLSKTKI